MLLIIGLVAIVGALACGMTRPSGGITTALHGASTPESLVGTPTVSSAYMWSRHTIGGGGGQTSIAIDPTNTNVVYVTTDNGGIIKTTDRGETWFSINNNIGNRLLADVELDPLDSEVLYVAARVYAKSPSWSDDPTNGELYRSRDGGQSWEIVYAEGMGAEDGRCFGIVQWPSTRNILIPYDPTDANRYDADGDHLTDVIYIGGWDEDEASADKRAGIWKSTDEGSTFTQIALHDKNIWVLRQDPDDPKTLYAGTYGDGLFVSRDEGATWEDWRDRIPVPMISDIAIVPNSDTLYVAINGFFSQYGSDEYRDRRGIYKSTDGGASFFPVNSGLEKTSLNFEVLLLDRTDPSGQTLYTGPWGGDRQGIYKTTDGGARWVQMKHEVLKHPHWFSRFDNLWALEQANDGTMFATSWRGIYRYDPARQRWEIKVNGLGNVSVRSIALDPENSSIIYLGILDSTPWKSVDKGLTWTSIGRGFTTTDGAQEAGASDFAISAIDPRIIYATGIGASGRYLSAVNKSQDGGAHWQRITNGLPATTSEDPQWEATAIVVNVHDPDVAYVALHMKSGGGRIYKTINGGKQWSELYAFPENPTDMAISLTEPETVVCTTERGIIHVGKEGGRQWQAYDLGLGLLYAVDIFPTDPDRILIGANIAGAFLTTDGGDSWQHIFDADDLQQFIGDLALSAFARERYQPTIKAVKFDSRDPNTLYIGHGPSIWMGIGVLKSTDGGQSWTSLADEGFQMRSVSVFDLDPEGNDLVVGTQEVYYYHPGEQ